MDQLNYFVPPPDYSDSDSVHSDQLVHQLYSTVSRVSSDVKTTTGVKVTCGSSTALGDSEEDNCYYETVRQSIISPPLGFGLKKSSSVILQPTGGKYPGSSEPTMNYLRRKTEALFFDSSKNQPPRPASTLESSCKVVNLTKKSGTSCIQIPYNENHYGESDLCPNYTSQGNKVSGPPVSEAIYSTVVKKSHRGDNWRQIKPPQMIVASSPYTPEAVFNSNYDENVETVAEVSEVMLSPTRTNWQVPLSKSHHKQWKSSHSVIDDSDLLQGEMTSLPPVMHSMSNCISISINSGEVNASESKHCAQVNIGDRPKRSMSMKSLALPSGAMSLEPMLNEFRFYQKTHKSILGQKSELQRAIEKRQAKEKLRVAEETKVNQKTGLERILESRAKKLISEMNEQQVQARRSLTSSLLNVSAPVAEKEDRKYQDGRARRSFKLPPLKSVTINDGNSSSSANSPVSPESDSSSASSSLTGVPLNGNSRALAAVFESAAAGKSPNNGDFSSKSSTAKSSPRTMFNNNHRSSIESILKTYNHSESKHSVKQGPVNHEKNVKPSIIDDESLRPAMGKVRTILNSIECNNRSSSVMMSKSVTRSTRSNQFT